MTVTTQTPFAIHSLQIRDHQGIVRNIYIMKVGYRMLPVAGQSGKYTAEAMVENPLPVCPIDRYRGENGRSSVIEENDLAAVKLRCDVIVNGHAYAPEGIPVGEWEAGIRLSLPPGTKNIDFGQDLPWKHGPEHFDAIEGPDGRMILIDKQLRCFGPRQFEKGPSGWQLTAPEPATEVALCWEHAFGGRAIALNPLGCGSADGLAATDEDVKTMPAPRIEAVDEPGKPAGLGAIGCTWPVRRALADAFEPHWRCEAPPALPEDFDYAYWNTAPRDQQIPFLRAYMRIELFNLMADGNAVVELPPHRPYVVLRSKAGDSALAMVTDTLLIDTDNMILSLTHRLSLPDGVDVHTLEACLEIDPTVKLFEEDEVVG